MGLPEGTLARCAVGAPLTFFGVQEQVLQRLVPPVRLSTLCLSNTGMYLAGGTFDGRIFFWEVRRLALWR